MPLVTLRNVSLHFGHRLIFDSIHLVIEPGERTCLLGQNGAGKSTLLKLIEGAVAPDSGEVAFQSGIRICSLPQDVANDLPGTVFEIVLSGLGETGKIVQEYEACLLTENLSEKDLERLHTLQLQMDHLNAWDISRTVEMVLSKLGLDGSLIFTSLSGGLRRRVLLARALVSKPDLLILDEPTNHLDLDSIRWLEEFLPQF
ncbi:MAG: ABC transporter ATP-binding protein, partial [Gammaproteobacteria bacterium]|nr:ABC transporter ATP-binding protein [Gammaproteobacteria bacterium]